CSGTSPPILAIGAVDPEGMRMQGAVPLTFGGGRSHRPRAAPCHGLLDALTDGGLGAALFWPLTAARCFAPVLPIPVAPIGPGIFSMGRL
ncbi:MAG TPA: hypothetical protein VE782_11770, partial [Myxococcaceae bacterium]|nr:hypothetical protein [Myxococcaceae bacterium]